MRYIPHENLRALVRTIVAAGGSTGDEPQMVADNLVYANLTGHDSHGVQMVPIYMTAVQTGDLVPNRHAEIVQDHGSVLTVDGHAGYGQVIGVEAMAIGIERAREHGVCVLATTNSFHLCRIGAWGEQCAKAGLVSTHHVNAIGNRGLVAPHGGTAARLSTNPWCCALPGTDTNPPFIADFATSVIAMGKVRVARNAGKHVPEGALFDADGQPTTDPDAMLEDPRGALRMVGGHKGHCLSLANEFLAGALTGGGTGRPENEHSDYTVINNMLSTIIDPRRLTAPGVFESELDACIDHIKSAPPEDPAQPVMMPGDPERRTMEQRLEHGIPMPDAAWAELVSGAVAVGLSESDAEALAEGEGG